MFRIDDNTYIDTSLITCAEYQLFLDEMHPQGYFFQPDQWSSYQFPKNKAQQPVLGIRSSDAISFCNWLTQRENSEWQYRIPTVKEGKSYPIQTTKTEISGYWASLVERSPTVLFNHDVGSQPILDLDLDNRLNLALTKYLEHAFARSRDVIRERERIRNNALNRSMIGNREHNLDQVLHFERELALRLSSDDKLKQTIEQFTEFKLYNQETIEGLNLIRNSASHHIKFLTRRIEKTLIQVEESISKDYRVVKDELEHAYRIARKRIDSIVRDSNRANKLTNDLDQKHTKDLDFVQKITTERNRMLTLALHNMYTIYTVRSGFNDHHTNLAMELVNNLDYIHLQAIAITQDDQILQKLNNNFEPILNRARTLSRDLYRFLLIPCLVDSIQNIVFLRLRIMNILEATEGIRVVKERKRG